MVKCNALILYIDIGHIRSLWGYVDRRYDSCLMFLVVLLSTESWNSIRFLNRSRSSDFQNQTKNQREFCHSSQRWVIAEPPTFIFYRPVPIEEVCHLPSKLDGSISRLPFLSGSIFISTRLATISSTYSLQFAAMRFSLFVGLKISELWSWMP